MVKAHHDSFHTTQRKGGEEMSARKKSLFITVATLSLIVVPVLAHAISYEDPSLTLGLNTSDLKSAVVRIINWVLGLLGIIFLVLMVYAGFLWMTAQGDPKQVDKAKSLLTQSVVGLVILLAAYAISTFVIESLQDAVSS